MSPGDSLQLSRREFLAAANAAALLMLLESCSLGPIGRAIATPSIPPGSSAYEQAIKLLLAAVRASPDHLTQRAADLVAARDATKIVEFVRDRIAVVPPLAEYDDAPTSGRWGPAATLRGGQGTVRDRADLLAEMLSQAGFKAQVQGGDLPHGISVDALYRPRAVAFSPDQAHLDVARTLMRGAGFPAPTAQQAINAGPDPAAAILAALPASLQVARVRRDLLPATVPVVVFNDGGKQRYALALGDVAIADSAPTRLGPRDATSYRNVTITVSALCNPVLAGATPRGRAVDLVTATWPSDQVVGRQVLLTFVPPQGPRAILDYGLATLPVRVPTLRVQTDSQPVTGGPNLIAAGSLVTVHGDVLGPSNASPTPATGMAGPFGTLKLLSDSDRTAAIARVAAIQAAANATAFQEVELEVAVKDASGAAIDGLDARSFSVKEHGATVDGFALYSNVRVQQRPRVLVIYDAYVAFAPDLFATDASKAAFESGLATAIVAQAGKTPFDVQVVGIGAVPDPQAWVAPDANHLAAAFAGAHESADDPWGSVGGPALEQGVSAIILISDMNSADTAASALRTYQRRLVASRVPVFTVPVGHIEPGTGPQIASMSGGASLDPADPSTPAKLAALVGPAVSAWFGGGYRIRYRAHPDGPSQRSVTVGLAGKDHPLGSTTYQVPAQVLPPPSFSGLFVTIAFGPLRSMRRLAGVEVDPNGTPLGPLDDPAAVAETRAAIDCITTIAFETGTPTTAAILDDVLSSHLSIAPLVPIWSTATNGQIVQALKNGVRRAPFMLPALLRPTAIDKSSVPGLRVAIIQERAPTPAAIEQHADLAVGLNEVIPLTTDRHAAFKAAVATSVAACAVEAATYPDSAYARLSGQNLQILQAGAYAAISSYIGTVPAARQQAWKAIARIYDGYHWLVPSGGAVDALWVVDPTTGVAKAVLLDSTGGAVLAKACHTDGEDAAALSIAILAIICSAEAAIYPFFCIEVNVLASAMCVTEIFHGKGDIGTPLGAIQPWLGLGEAGLAGLDAAIGMMLLLITLSSAGCI